GAHPQLACGIWPTPILLSHWAISHTAILVEELKSPRSDIVLPSTISGHGSNHTADHGYDPIENTDDSFGLLNSLREIAAHRSSEPPAITGLKAGGGLRGSACREAARD